MRLARWLGIWLAAVAVAAVLLIALSVLVLDNPWTDALPNVVGIAVALPISALVAGRMQGRNEQSLLARGVVEGAIRTTDDSPVGRGGQWRTAQMHLSRGRIHLVPLLGGVRFVKGAPVDVSVEAVQRTDRRTRLGMNVNGGLSILTARSSIGALEIAVQPNLAEVVLARLAP